MPRSWVARTYLRDVGKFSEFSTQNFNCFIPRDNSTAIPWSGRLMFFLPLEDTFLSKIQTNSYWIDIEVSWPRNISKKQKKMTSTIIFFYISLKWNVKIEWQLFYWADPQRISKSDRYFLSKKLFLIPTAVLPTGHLTTAKNFLHTPPK